MELREILLKEIERWAEKYQFSFQFWGIGNNNVFISKDHVDLYSSGGFDSANDVMIDALNYVYRINRTPKRNRVIQSV